MIHALIFAIIFYCVNFIFYVKKIVQIEEMKEDNALPIDTLINISKEEINKLKEIKILFKNIYDTLSNDEKDKIRSRIYEIKEIFNHYMKLNKKLSKKGKKISKAQRLQINKTKVGVNRLHALHI